MTADAMRDKGMDVNKAGFWISSPFTRPETKVAYISSKEF